jgi:hypothetical protein
MSPTTVWTIAGPLLAVLIAVVTILAERARRRRRRHFGIDPTGPTQWVRSTTNRERVEVGVEPPCDGSPFCAGAIHMRDLDPSGFWRQLHLGYREMQRIRDLVEGCLAVYEAAGRPR